MKPKLLLLFALAGIVLAGSSGCMFQGGTQGTNTSGEASGGGQARGTPGFEAALVPLGFLATVLLLRKR